MSKNKISVFPAPTKYISLNPSGRDFLGQQSIIQSLANRCLPSFTNATKRLRYYSFWAWAIKMAQRHTKELSKDNAVWWYLMRLENALIIANKYINPKFNGLIGVEGVPIEIKKLIELKDNDLIPIYSERDRATAYDSPQYSPSLNSLHIVSYENGNFNISNFGNRLAEAFDNVISKSKYYDKLLDPRTKELTIRELKNLCIYLSLEEISKDERKIFLEVIEQNESGSLSSQKVTPRIYSTLLLLDIIKKHQIDTPKSCQQKLLDKKYKSGEQLDEIRTAYKIIEMRRHFQFAVETILTSFCRYLNSFDNNESTFDKFSKECYLYIDKYKIDNISIFKKATSANVKFSEFYREAINYSSKNHKDFYSYESKIRNLISNHSSASSTEAVMHSILLIIHIQSEIKLLQDSKSQLIKSFISYPASYNFSINSLDNFIKKIMKESSFNAIKKIIIELSLKLHLAVSQEKLFQVGNFTFRYIRAEPFGFKLLQSIKRPVMTGNKLFSYFHIIEDLGLIKKDKNYYRLTTNGEKFYNDYLN